MFPITTVFLGGKNKASVDITESSNQSTSGWSDITQVAITQSIPAADTPPKIYHVVSFDNKATWKVFKSSTWTSVVRNNSETWQYSNAGSWTNASSNTQAQAIIQATDQTSYQWLKAEVEALSTADWKATGGFTSGSYFHWAVRLINGSTIVADGSTNTSTDYATNAMSSASSGGHIVTCNGENSAYGYYAWKAFDKSTADYSWWQVPWAVSTGSPATIMIDLGASNAKVINKYQWYPVVAAAGNPADWKLQGTNNTSAAVGDSESANGWTTLDEESHGSSWACTSWYTCTFSNSTAYRYYRMINTCYRPNGAYYWLSELKLIAAQTSDVTPTFTKIAVQYES